MPVAVAVRLVDVAGDTVARDSAARHIDLDLDNPDIGAPSRPAAARRDRVDPAAAGRTRPGLQHDDAEDAAHRQRGGSQRTAIIATSRCRSTCRASRSISTRRRRADEPHHRARSISPTTAPTGQDPLARKLELAEEFQHIGDKDGARDLLREVLATASGATKTKAQGMLDRIS